MGIEHTSGHASVKELQRLAAALAPNRIVPIHTFGAESFINFFPCVEIYPDETWWDV